MSTRVSTITLMTALAVAALSGCGGGDKDATGAPTSSPSTPATPITPVFRVVVVNDTSMLLTWPVDTNTTRYVITRNGVPIASPAVNISKGTFTDTSLIPSTAYTYTVQACNATSCSAIGTAPAKSTMTSALAAAVTANSSDFYTQSILLDNVPDLPADIPTFAATPYNSFKATTTKGNDAWSTKRLDLVTWYNAIRFGDSTVWKEYTGTAPVFAELPKWEVGAYRMGILNKQWQTNALDFYNFTRALFGAQWNYMSGYKTVAAQAAAMSNLNGGHGPSSVDATDVGIVGPMFDAIAFARGSSNLMGGPVNKTANYGAMTSFPMNAKLASIWSESESGRIAEMGHRAAFMYAPGRDIGIGGVSGYHTWMAYGANPTANKGQLLGGDAQKATFERWPAGPVQAGGVQTWPSHGYFPFFMLRGNNQAWSTKLSGTVKSPAKGERITLKMEYFVHTQDGDLTTLTAPVQTITLTAVVGDPKGGSGPDYANAEMIPGGGTGAQFQQGGGYYFTANGSSFPYKWRMPTGWYNEMAKDLASTNPTPRYHTVRSTFLSDGDGFKVRNPFYMNPNVDAPMVIQTTFFDIQRQTGAY